MIFLYKDISNNVQKLKKELRRLGVKLRCSVPHLRILWPSEENSFSKSLEAEEPRNGVSLWLSIEANVCCSSSSSLSLFWLLVLVFLLFWFLVVAVAAEWRSSDSSFQLQALLPSPSNSFPKKRHLSIHPSPWWEQQLCVGPFDLAISSNASASLLVPIPPLPTPWYPSILALSVAVNFFLKWVFCNFSILRWLTYALESVSFVVFTAFQMDMWG